MIHAMSIKWFSELADSDESAVARCEPIQRNEREGERYAHCN